MLTGTTQPFDREHTLPRILTHRAFSDPFCSSVGTHPFTATAHDEGPHKTLIEILYARVPFIRSHLHFH